MINDNDVAFAIGRLEGWVERVGEEFKLQTTEPLKYLAFLEETLKEYRNTRSNENV